MKTWYPRETIVEVDIMSKRTYALVRCSGDYGKYLLVELASVGDGFVIDHSQTPDNSFAFDMYLKYKFYDYSIETAPTVKVYDSWEEYEPVTGLKIAEIIQNLRRAV